MEDEGDGNSVYYMQSWGVGVLEELGERRWKLKEKDVNDGETQITFVKLIIKIFI